MLLREKLNIIVDKTGDKFFMFLVELCFLSFLHFKSTMHMGRALVFDFTKSSPQGKLCTMSVLCMFFLLVNPQLRLMYMM